jgi:hypothetical protein
VGQVVRKPLMERTGQERIVCPEFYRTINPGLLRPSWWPKVQDDDHDHNHRHNHDQVDFDVDDESELIGS